MINEKPYEYLEKYIVRHNAAAARLDMDSYDCFINMLKQTIENNSKIFVFGNGGSGTTASHFVCDINKGVSYGKNKKYKVICLNDNMASITAYANDVGYEDIFVEQLKNYMSSKDLVVAISGSGNSENVIKAISYARENDAETFGLIGFSGGKLAKIAKNIFIVHSNEMQIVEDIHLMLLHSAMQILNKHSQ